MKAIEAAKKNIITVKRSLSLRDILSTCKNFHTHPFIPVVDDYDKLIGVVYSDNLLDLLRPSQTKIFRHVPFLEMDEDIFDLEPVSSMGELIIAEDIMDTNFTVIPENLPLQEAYKIMRLNKKELLPVVDDTGKITGILGLFDIIWRMFKEKEIV